MEQTEKNERVSLTNKTMILGTILGAYQIVKYLVFALSLSMPSMSFLFIIMALGVPVVAFYLQKRFRDKYSPKVFPFFVSWMTSFLTFFYSVVLSMVVCYIALELFDKDGTFFTLLSNQMVVSADLYRSIEGVDAELIEMMDRYAKAFSTMQPLALIKMVIPTVFSTGNILSVIIAALTTISIRKSLQNR